MTIRDLLSESKKIIGLAPMAGFTDSSFRMICKDFGADLVYTEMVSARGIVEDKNKSYGGKSLRLAKFDARERPILVQIFGREPEIMAEAAAIICEKFNPEGIDINMGCPARKVIANDYGSSLIKEPELAGKIVQNVKKSVPNYLVTVKTRLGWEKSDEIFEFAKILENAGADMVSVHCRTKSQNFSGLPDWKILSRLKQEIQIPILANGGILSREDAIACLDQTLADGILIGQGALGRPWIFQEIKENMVKNYNFDEILNIALEHIQYSISLTNFSELRKHLLCYFKGFPGSNEFRRSICKCNCSEEFKDLANKFLVSGL